MARAARSARTVARSTARAAAGAAELAPLLPWILGAVAVVWILRRTTSAAFGFLADEGAPPESETVQAGTDESGAAVEATPIETGTAVLGGAAVVVAAQMVNPAPGGEVSRNFLSAWYPVELELQNYTAQPQTVRVEVQAEYDRLGGIETILHDAGTWTLKAKELRRVKAELDSGNRHTGLFEFGAASVFARVLVGGKLTSSTYYLVK